MILPANVLALEFEHEGIFYVTIDDTNDVMTKPGTNDISSHNVSGDVVIPATVNYNGITYDVVKIGEKSFGSSYIKTISLPESVNEIDRCAFMNSRKLISIKLPNGITTISSNSFADCVSLRSIEIPAKVTDLEDYAFQNCKSLQTVRILGEIKSIGWGCFAECSSLEYIDNLDSVEKLGFNTFNKCTSLKSISIQGVTAFPNFVFNGCTNLETVNLNKKIITIDYSAFADCENLNSIDLGDCLRTIGDNAFNGCHSLRSIEIPNTVLAIGKNAFASCKSLTDIKLSENLDVIENEMFAGCTSLTHFEIPNTITDIGNGAFSGCSQLRWVSIPASVTSIGSSAFPSNLKNVFYETDDPTETSANAFKSRLNLYTTEAGAKRSSEIEPWMGFQNIGVFDFKNNPFRDITFESDHVSLELGKSVRLQPYVYAITTSSMSIPSFTWASTNEEVATVSADGTVTATGYGETTISVNCGGLIADCQVSVPAPEIESITLSETEISLKVGESTRLDVTIEPEGANQNQIYWTTSNRYVVSVDNGVIQARAAGVALVSAWDRSGHNADCNVSVFMPIEDELVKLSVAINEIASTEVEAIKGRATNIKLTPNRDWSVASITVNGNEESGCFDAETGIYTTDILKDDTEIVAYIEYSGPEMTVDQFSGIATVPESSIKIYRGGSNLFIEGTTAMDVIDIYNISGLHIKHIVPTSDDKIIRVAMQPNQCYIVTINGYGHKIQF